MMAGLGVGGVAVGMFHLITHAFFKALLFMGAGSVIHGCHEEQDVRRMGGLRHAMPVTFLTYAAGMLALCGVPIFAGFWSKDGILEAAHGWGLGRGPFYMLVIGAGLTAFYMTRQVSYVFFGSYRGHGHAHESPKSMTTPLAILAFFAVTLGLIGTPAWPWFSAFLNGAATRFGFEAFAEPGLVSLMGTSILVVAIGIGLGWWLYGGKSAEVAARSALCGRVLRDDGDCVLWLVGAGRGLDGPARMGWRGYGSRMGVWSVGHAEQISGCQCGGRYV
jgi:NADH-quinone oxidoreductase subunit L